jgi:DNA-binding HxlR family transcriptional regulator
MTTLQKAIQGAERYVRAAKIAQKVVCVIPPRVRYYLGEDSNEVRALVDALVSALTVADKDMQEARVERAKVRR